MPRPKDPVWQHFGEIMRHDNKAFGKTACRHCDEVVIAKTDRLSNHLSKCKKVKRSIGQLLSGSIDLSNDIETMDLVDLGASQPPSTQASIATGTSKKFKASVSKSYDSREH